MFLSSFFIHIPIHITPQTLNFLSSRIWDRKEAELNALKLNFSIKGLWEVDLLWGVGGGRKQRNQKSKQQLQLATAM